MTIVGLTSIEDPVFTYNSLTKLYNLTYLGYGPSYNGMVIVSMDISDLGNTNELMATKVITPLAN